MVRTATGNDSETLDWASWNVKEFVGQQAQIRVVDNNRFGWGHILADEFMLSSKPAQSALETYDWLDYGRDYYASVSFGNMPENKRVMLGLDEQLGLRQQHPHQPVAQRHGPAPRSEPDPDP